MLAICCPSSTSLPSLTSLTSLASLISRTSLTSLPVTHPNHITHLTERISASLTSRTFATNIYSHCVEIESTEFTVRRSKAYKVAKQIGRWKQVAKKDSPDGSGLTDRDELPEAYSKALQRKQLLSRFLGSRRGIGEGSVRSIMMELEAHRDARVTDRLDKLEVIRLIELHKHRHVFPQTPFRGFQSNQPIR
eukprot:GHVN01029465.1.p1 GENE.GHVN01029465.1~~GHVN01029465.1.p1  ORF type:complete len:192 (-),score=51.04 GHVN01029465.1:119-694(-)